jgi:hypothetical protein
MAEEATGAAADQALPRTAWGAPDLSGVWDFRTITPLERPGTLADKEFLTDEEAEKFEAQTLQRLNFDNRAGAARFDLEQAYNAFWWDWGDELTADKRTSLIVDPPNGRIPPVTEGEKEAQARRRNELHPVRQQVVIGSRAHGPEDLGLSERCILGFNAGPPMVPSAYNNNVQIFQAEDSVALLVEMIHDVRIVPLDGRPQLDDSIRQWIGSSRGRWDGDTLVVETTNFTDKTPSFSGLVGGSMGTGLTLRLVERLTRIDEGTLLYEFTIDDPHTFSQSWTAALPMKLSDSSLYEYACHEGNYGMTNLLSGARAQERKAANGP